MAMRVLVVCSSFPPVNATAVHRTVALCRHLAAQGHEVRVLTIKPDPQMPTDPSLLRKVPRGLKVVRAPCLRPTSVIAWFRKRREPRDAPKPAPPRGDGERSDGPAPPSGGAWCRLCDWVSWWLNVPDPCVGSGSTLRARRPRISGAKITGLVWCRAIGAGRYVHLANLSSR